MMPKKLQNDHIRDIVGLLSSSKNVSILRVSHCSHIDSTIIVFRYNDAYFRLSLGCSINVYRWGYYEVSKAKENSVSVSSESIDGDAFVNRLLSKASDSEMPMLMLDDGWIYNFSLCKEDSSMYVGNKRLIDVRVREFNKLAEEKNLSFRLLIVAGKLSYRTKEQIKTNEYTSSFDLRNENEMLVTIASLTELYTLNVIK